MPYKIIRDEAVIGMPPGIGDLSWIMTKMESFKKENNIKKIKIVMNLVGGGDGHYGYSLEYLKLLPFVESAAAATTALEFEYALAGGSGTPLFEKRSGCDYLIEFNSRLENHTKLKDILPQYETNYDYPIKEPAEAKEFAQALRVEIGEKFVLLFTAARGTNNAWVGKLWGPEKWMALARIIYKKTGCKPVLIGAKWDADYTDEIIKLDADNIIHDMVGKLSVAHLFALLREANILIAFTCGVGIMATQFRTPVVTLWPIKNKRNPKGKFNRAFMRTWLPPWAKKVGYIPLAWGDKEATPNGIFNAVRKYI